VFRAALHEILASPNWLSIGTRSGQRPGRRKLPKATSLEIYERRLPVYRTAVNFVRDVVKDLRPELQLILQFNTDTEQALFLFDETVDAYLTDLFKRALRLRTINLLRQRMERDSQMENFAALVQEETALAMWFTNQYDVIRHHFAPFLRLA
jgi:hypothetical protein